MGLYVGIFPNFKFQSGFNFTLMFCQVGNVADLIYDNKNDVLER